MTEQKERLIQLLEAEGGFSRYMTDDERRAKLADHLLENGVIVPPTKVRPTVEVYTEHQRLCSRGQVVRYQGNVVKETCYKWNEVQTCFSEEEAARVEREWSALAEEGAKP